jgi:hypothetical protein
MQALIFWQRFWLHFQKFGNGFGYISKYLATVLATLPKIWQFVFDLLVTLDEATQT